MGNSLDFVVAGSLQGTLTVYLDLPQLGRLGLSSRLFWWEIVIGLDGLLSSGQGTCFGQSSVGVASDYRGFVT